MLLDEPTQGMGHEDVHRDHAQLIKKVAAGRTMLMVEHNMSVVAVASPTRSPCCSAARCSPKGPYAEVSKNPAGDRSLHGQRRRPSCRERTDGARRFLEVAGLHAWYGESHVLHGVDFHVDEGEVVTLLGRNGAGRTTTLRAIMGLTGARKGSIKVNGTETDRPADAPHRPPGHRLLPRRARHLLEPVGRREPDAAADARRRAACPSSEIYAMFPNLKERAAARARACRAASSRCWPSRASCAPARACCCSTRSPKAWRRSSCRSSAR